MVWPRVMSAISFSYSSRVGISSPSFRMSSGTFLKDGCPSSSSDGRISLQPTSSATLFYKYFANVLPFHRGARLSPINFAPPVQRLSASTVQNQAPKLKTQQKWEVEERGRTSLILQKVWGGSRKIGVTGVAQPHIPVTDRIDGNGVECCEK